MTDLRRSTDIANAVAIQADGKLVVVASRAESAIRSVFYSRQRFWAVYVHMNMKALLRRLWARISRRLAAKPQQMELDLWTRRSRR
jgi:hypothetical protein